MPTTPSTTKHAQVRPKGAHIRLVLVLAIVLLPTAYAIATRGERRTTGYAPQAAQHAPQAAPVIEAGAPLQPAPELAGRPGL